MKGIRSLPLLKKVGILVLLFGILAGSQVLALTIWNLTVTWQKSALSFTVYTDATMTIEWESDQTLPLGVLEGSHTEDFWIENTGNVPVKVTAITDSLSGADIAWTPRNYLLLNTTLGETIGVLTLEIDNVIADGSLAFHFAASAP